MATDLENLRTTKSQIVSRLKEVTASAHPSYSVDGVSIDKNTYRSQLLADLKAVQEQILLEETMSNGPYELETREYC